ncbi:MAG: DUF4876 domain-containing protein [Bacteroidales bacterium]|nr:DUF4876 domain-containing protein [Bacteroidales bacterium]
MKRIITASIILAAALLSFSCKRQAPSETGSFLLEFKLPAECRETAFYANRTVSLTGEVDYEFQTDVCGMVNVPGIVPGIYDIITNTEMSGKEYKALLKDPDAQGIEDKARVVVGLSLMNQRIFEARDISVMLNAAVIKGLLISKIYYSGTRDKMDRTYTTDSYVELFNNSDEVQYLDGKYLGLAESVSPAAYPAKDNPDSIYLRQCCRFPGSGTDYPVQPGSSVVIAARSARNHLESALNTVDLSSAAFEVKLTEGSGNPDAPMLPLITNSTSIQYLNLLSGGPNTLVLFETDEDVMSWPQVYQIGKTSGERFLRIHKKVVTDGVECLKKPAQTDPDVNTKRLQEDIDAGYITITSVNGYNHESVERRVSRQENGRCYLVDTNNSSADFVVCTDPTPQKYDKEGLL